MRWHVPTSTQVPLRFQLTRIMCVTVVVATLVMVVSEEQLRLPLLATVAMLGMLLAGWKIISTAFQPRREPNVWLDSLGLHWLNQAGEEQCLARESITGFWIGLDDATRLNVPSLTFLLRDGFLSQPLELHSPATPLATREWLLGEWNIDSLAELPAPETFAIPLAIEYDDTMQLWQFRGPREELEKLLGVWWELATRYPLPPRGARPKECVIECGDADCGVVIASHCWIQYATLSISPEKLQSLVTEIRTRWEANANEVEISLTCDTGHHWRLLLEVQDPANTDKNIALQ